MEEVCVRRVREGLDRFVPGDDREWGRVCDLCEWVWLDDLGEWLGESVELRKMPRRGWGEGVTM